jgi:uncharacterized cupin superfamily protein
VGVEKVNILTVELDERLDEAGFRHAEASVGSRLGARRSGASVYEAEAGVPIWPYHYHHGIEEWLYVIAGAPVLREPAGERALAPGEVVRFPSGGQGAHTVKGPGRFLILATGAEPYLSVYPDSDKVSGPEGILLRSSAVGYWHGEGTAGRVDADPVREPAGSLGPLLETTTVELAPGQEGEPYHYVYGREAWLLVLAGTPTLRHPDGHERLERGDLVCFAEGPAGARQLLNRGDAGVRALCLSTTGLPANVYYPDTEEWLLRNAPGQTAVSRGGG